MKQKQRLAVLALALAATTVAVAQQQPCGSCPSAGAHKGKAAPAAEMAKPALPNIPELTEAQQQKLDNANITHIRAITPLRADIDVAETELEALWRAEKLDAKAITDKVRRISDLRAQLELANVNHRLAVAGVLSPEQRKAMGPGMRHGRRGMGRGCGMMGAMMPPMMRGMMEGCGGEGGACAGGGCKKDAGSD